MIFVGKTEKTYDATLTATKAAKSAAFSVDAGVASSNGGAAARRECAAPAQ